MSSVTARGGSPLKNSISFDYNFVFRKTNIKCMPRYAISNCSIENILTDYILGHKYVEIPISNSHIHILLLGVG